MSLARPEQGRDSSRDPAQPSIGACILRLTPPESLELMLRTRVPVIVAILAVFCATAAADGAGDANQDPIDLLQRAFGRMFNYPSVRTIEMDVTRNGKLVSRREFDVIYRRIDDRDHTLLRFKNPEYLRGDGLLVLESEDGRNDAWLYQPEVQRLRRVGTHQKGDTFYGSDITFEDLEHHRWERFQARRLEDGEVGERPVYVLEVTPPPTSSYSKLVVGIEKERTALAFIDFFHRDPEVPTKRMELDLDTITEQDGYLKPGRFTVTQNGRQAMTEMRFTRVEVGPEIPREVFSSIRLQREGEDLYDLVARINESAR